MACIISEYSAFVAGVLMTHNFWKRQATYKLLKWVRTINELLTDQQTDSFKEIIVRLASHLLNILSLIIKLLSKCVTQNANTHTHKPTHTHPHTHKPTHTHAHTRLEKYNKEIHKHTCVSFLLTRNKSVYTLQSMQKPTRTSIIISLRIFWLRLSIQDNAATPFPPWMSLFCFSLGRSPCQFHLFKSPSKGFLRVIFGLPCFLLPGGFHLKTF